MKFPDFDYPDGDRQPRKDEGFLDRVVEEILDPVDFYWAGKGPEGPWPFKSLAVKRSMNRILIEDVDGEYTEYLVVPDLSNHQNPYKALKVKLKDVNEREMRKL